MKHNKYPLSFLLACFATAASLAGCTWDSSLYDDFVNKSTNKVITCEGGLGITLPNGVYAYQYPKNTENYYCGTYNEIGHSPSHSPENLADADARKCENYHNLGFSSFEAFKAYFEKMRQDPEEGSYSLCPANTLSCSPLHVQTSLNESDTIDFCNACEKDSVICDNTTMKCTPINTNEHCGSCSISCNNNERCEYSEKDSSYICVFSSTCPPGKYYGENGCKENDDDNCGKAGYACNATNIAGWKTGSCNKNEGKCKATECETGYNLNDGTCEARTSCPDPNTHYYNGECMNNEMDHCGKHNHKCASITGWLEGTCTNGVCVPSECQIGYHLNEGSCVADDNQNCGSVGNVCGPGQVCTDGNCSDNCGSGEVRCEKGGVISCADPNTSTTFCGANASCSTYITCEPGQACVGGECKQNSCTGNKTLCVVNGENVCINVTSNNANHCGACNLKCSDRSMPNASSTTCSNGQCQYRCNLNYTNCGISTVPNCINNANFKNDPNNCGGCGNRCNSDELCSNSTCKKSTCTNQCLSNGTCVNTNDKCGTQCIDCNSANNAASGTCSTSGRCTITACIAGYHLTADKTCELNTPTACGSTNKPGTINCKTHNHASDGYCENGQCVATSCDTGYHVVGGECVEDSPTACGAGATNCTKLEGLSTDNNAVECKDGKCNAKACRQDYHLTGPEDEKKCIHDSSTACGSDSKNCESISYATRAYCDKGTCYVINCEDGYTANNPPNSHGTCQCDNSSCSQIPTDSHIKTRSCQSNKCVIQSCETHYSPNTDNTACVCNSDSCNETNIKNATTASCISNECHIECLSGHSYNKESGACECSGNSCASTVNTTCNTDKTCCRPDDNTDTNNITSEPTCCNNNCLKQTSGSSKTFYKCSNTTSTNGGWISCKNG